MTSQDHLAQALAGAAVAVVQPGDTLLIAFARAVSRSELDEISRELRTAIPESIRIAILDQCSGMFVVRPDGAA